MATRRDLGGAINDTRRTAAAYPGPLAVHKRGDAIYFEASPPAVPGVRAASSLEVLRAR